MSKIISALSFGAALLYGTVAYAAGNTASVNANATANVVSPITVTKSSDLSFGDFTSDKAACTVAVGATGNQTITGNCASLGSGTVSAAVFTIGGSGNRSFTTNVSATSPTLNDGAGHTMAFTLQNSAPTHLTNGAATINVYGSLAVAANQAAGSYADTITVTLSY